MFRHFKSSLLWTLSLILAAAFLHSLPSTISVSTNVTGTELPITCVSRTDQKIALTFNLSGDNCDLSKLLQILEENQTPSTFFLTEAWVVRFPDDARQLVEYGHELGILGDNSVDFSSLDKEKLNAVLKSSRDKISDLTGYTPKFFRPPYGTYTNLLIRTASELGLQTVTWNIDSQDWKDYGPEVIAGTIKADPELSGGSILYFHADAKYTPQALDILLPSLLDSGYTFSLLSELLHEKPYHLNAHGCQISDE